MNWLNVILELASRRLGADALFADVIASPEAISYSFLGMLQTSAHTGGAARVPSIPTASSQRRLSEGIGA